jgi:hypothetical protein
MLPVPYKTENMSTMISHRHKNLDTLDNLVEWVSLAVLWQVLKERPWVMLRRGGLLSATSTS